MCIFSVKPSLRLEKSSLLQLVDSIRNQHFPETKFVSLSLCLSSDNSVLGNLHSPPPLPFAASVLLNR